MLEKADAAATQCTSHVYQCISEGASPFTRGRAGQNSSSENRRGAKGTLSASSTTITEPTWNGYAHWYGVTDTTPPAGYGVSIEWMQAGIANGAFNGNGGYPKNSDYNWYSEVYSWCNQGPGGSSLWIGAGGYTPGTSHVIETSQLDGSYDCGSGGATTVWMARTFFNGQLAATGWILTYGSQLRSDVNTEYVPYTWLNPVGRVCFGSSSPGTTCNTSATAVQRLVSATWSNWDSTQTNKLLGSYGLTRNDQTDNTRFNVTSIW